MDAGEAAAEEHKDKERMPGLPDKSETDHAERNQRCAEQQDDARPPDIEDPAHRNPGQTGGDVKQQGSHR